MKNFFTLTLCFLTLSLTAQIDNFPFNPDSNSDGLIGVDDLMAMLSNFGEPFELPDYTEWSIGTMNNLLEYNEELDSMSMSLSVLQEFLDSSYAQVELLQDSLSMITEFNTYIQTSNRCNISITDFNYVSSNVHYDIPNTCGCVGVKMEYGQTWSAPDSRAKIRLPQEGLFPGQRIFMFNFPDYSDAVPQDIHHFVDGQWVYLTSITESSSPGGVSFGSSSANKIFTWTGENWTAGSGIYQISYQN